MQLQTETPPVAVAPDDGMREFLIVLRRALLLIVGYIETRYQLADKRGKVDNN